LVLRHCSTDVNVPVDLGGGVSAHPNCPIPVPDHWREWLGSLQTGVIEAANLVLAVEIPSQTPTILDAETHALDSRLTALWRGLLLQGIPTYQDIRMLFGGVDDSGQSSVRRVSRPVDAVRHQQGNVFDVTTAVLVNSKRAADRLEGLYAARPDYRRVRAGLHALNSGVEERGLEERLHQFVRALDGLMMLPQGRSRREFIARGPTFVAGTDLPTVLGQLYDLRSTQEHLNELGPVIHVATPIELERVVSRRSYQAEQAALAAYRQLLDGGSLGDFRTEATIEAFWQLGEGERRRRWGSPLDLDSL
jgi:hypothetical protein